MKEAAAPGAARTKPDAVAAGKMPRRNKHGIKQGSHRDDACAERDQKSYAEFLVVHFMGWGRADDRHLADLGFDIAAYLDFRSDCGPNQWPATADTWNRRNLNPSNPYLDAPH